MQMPGKVPQALRITSALDELTRLYPWLEAAGAQAGLARSLLQGMQVALEEVVMNVAMHAYAPGSGEIIAVELAVNDEFASLCVDDTGPAFNPLEGPVHVQPQSLEQARVGGLGLKLMRHYCQHVGYAREAGHNRLTMKFSRKAAD